MQNQGHENNNKPVTASFERMELLSSLPGLLSTEHWADVSIQGLCHQGQATAAVRAHLPILAALSPFWRRQWQDLEEGFVVVLPGEDLSSVQSALALLYSGEVQGGEEQVRGAVAVLERLLPEVDVDMGRYKGGWVVTINQREVFQEEEIVVQKEIKTEVNAENVKGSLQIKPVRPKKRKLSPERDMELDVENVPSSSPKCSQCSKTFRYQKDLRKHELVHSGELPFGCAVCKRYFRNKSNLYKHLREKHSVKDVKSNVLDLQGRLESEETTRKAAEVDVEALLATAAVIGSSASGAPTMRCPVCEKLVTRKALRAHLNMHAGVRPYPCERCEMAFFSATGLLKHCENMHDGAGEPVIKEQRKTFRCSFCPETLSTEEERTAHTSNTHRNSLPFSCSECNKNFSLRSTLLIHQRTIHQMRVGREQLHACRHCQKVFVGKTELAKHKLAEHREMAEELCSTCGKGFVTVDQLTRHEATHGERPRPLKCAHCPKTYFRRDVLELHERVHTKPVECFVCSKKFPHQRNLDSHVKHMHGEVTEEEGKEISLQFVCFTCDEVFDNESHLVQHQEEQNHSAETDQQQMFSCDSCSLEFLLETDLEKHVESLHPIVTNPFICRHCDESCKTLYSLKRHLSKHQCLLAKEGSDCTDCLQDLKTSTRLRKHVLRNIAKRVISCPDCPKLFRTQQELTNHSHTHTGSKPHVCSECPERFSQSSTLHQHLERHRRGLIVEKFPCGVCDKSLKTHTAWKAHRRTHGDENVEFGAILKPEVVATARLPPEEEVMEGLDETDSNLEVTLKDFDGQNLVTYKIIDANEEFFQLP